MAERFSTSREWEALSPDEQKYLIKIRPPGDVISRTLRHVVLSKAMTSAAIIHDNTIRNLQTSLATH